MSGPPVSIVQALIDITVESTLLQCFITGLYTLLYLRAIVPLLKSRRNIYSLVLTLLWAMIIINLASAWHILRSVVVINDESRETIEAELFGGPPTVPRLANASGSIAILLADTLLVWRCWVFWQRNMFVLVGFGLLLLGELALIPTYLVLNVMLGPHKISIIVLYFLMSAGITTVATGMITFRILQLSKQRQEHMRQYERTIQIIVESGLMYTLTLFITAVLLAVQGSSFDPIGVVQAASYFGAILTPVTGIAPTLTAYRIMSGMSVDDEKWSQPVSRIPMNNMTREGQSTVAPATVDDIHSPPELDQNKSVV